MPAQKIERIARIEMSPEERRLRSRLIQLLSGGGVLRGSLSLRYRTCGNPGCKCARGEGHRGLYLVYRQGGRLRQVFIPRPYEAQVQQWVDQYQEVRQLLEALSEVNLAKVPRKRGGGGV
jgi:Family of unknown function (DUF6788)